MSDSHHHEDGQAHVVPVWLNVAVGGALLVLTVITVAVAQIGFGRFDLWVALAIATVKAALVVLFFMHLFWDKPVNMLVFIVSLITLSLFLGITIMDSTEYQPEMIPDHAPALEVQADATPSGQ